MHQEQTFPKLSPLTSLPVSLKTLSLQTVPAFPFIFWHFLVLLTECLGLTSKYEKAPLEGPVAEADPPE